MASSFLKPEVSSPKEALYITEERPSDINRSREKLWQAAASSSYEKFRSVPEGGSGSGPEGFRGPLEATDLKLPIVFRAEAL